MESEQLAPLDDEDLRTLAVLLARFAANHLDQWEAWRLELPEGPVDVHIGVSTNPANQGINVVWPRR